MYINCRNLTGHKTGVQRYTESIINCWDSEDICFSKILPKAHMAAGFKGHFWEQFVLPLSMKKKHNILWSPCNTGPLWYHNQILTIHDTVPFDHPEWLNKKFVSWYQFLQPKLVKKVKHIITISQFSKERIMEHCHVPSEKISVVYNGVNLCATLEVDPRQDFKNLDSYILSVGSLEPRKNINNLINAFLEYKKLVPSNLKLVIVGKDGVGRVFNQNNIDKKINSDVLFTGHVSDAELQWLYQNALGFCYPSLYEGFGLPPIEAMQYCIPVLTSNNTAMQELCRGRAILVDPYSSRSIVEGLDSLIRGGISQEQLISNQAYAKTLSWSRCATETYKVIENFI